MNPGERIRELRRSLGWSTHALAQACNMREGYLLEIEENATPDPVHSLTFRKIADALGTTLDYILGNEPIASVKDDVVEEVPPEYQWLVKWTMRLIVSLGTIALIVSVFTLSALLLLALYRNVR